VDLKKVFDEVKLFKIWNNLSFSEQVRVINKVTRVCELYKKYDLDEKLDAIDSKWVIARINRAGYNRFNKLDHAYELALREIESMNLFDMEKEKQKIVDLWEGNKELEYSI